MLSLLAFSIRADVGGLTVLYSFAGQADGGNPQGAIVLGSDGALYGAAGTSADSDGTIFRLTQDGSLTTLHGFVGTDGQMPLGLVQGPDGNLYGVTASGGPGTSNYSGANSYGTIFRIGIDGTFTSLYAFNSGVVGTSPNSLILGADGAFYGTAGESGVANQFGAIFRMTLDGTVTSLYTFTGNGQGGFSSSGAYPATLVQGADGSFYGTTGYGAYGSAAGSVFKYSASQGVSNLHNFDASVDGTAIPNALVPASDGSIYGTTAGTVNDQLPGLGYDNGTIFRIAPDGSITYLYRFAGPDGSTPAFGGLSLGRDGRLYGVTTAGGANGNGILYSIGTDGGAFIILHTFNSADGNYPDSPLLQIDSGAFVGTTRTGGASGNGVAYRLTPSASAPTVSLVASATTVAIGQSVTLTWSSSSVTSCAASGQWSGTLPPSGSQSVVVPGSGANLFTITCTGTDGSSVSRSATVNAIPAPTVNLSGDTTVAVTGQWVILKWSSTNASSCTASGAWSGSVSTSGTQAVQIQNPGTNAFDLVCGTAGVNASAQVTVTAYAPRLSLSPVSASPYALTQLCVSAQVQDDATGTPLGNIPVEFAISGVDSGGNTRNTDSSGMAQQCWTGSRSGTDTLTARSGNASATAVINWLKRPATMRAQGFIAISISAVGSSGLLTFSAQLSDTLNGAPVGGRLVAFSVNNSAACQTFTDTSGNASCQSLPGTLSVLGHLQYHASFAGDPIYLPASADAPLLSLGR